MIVRKDPLSKSRPKGSLRVPSSTLHDSAADVLAGILGRPSVTLKIDGSPMVVAFEPDLVEHQRRTGSHVGAVTSTPLLHALWLLPAGVPVPASAIPTQKAMHLRSAPHSVAETETGFERLYSPPGIVQAVAFVGQDASRIVERAIRFTPIFQRFVIAPSGTRLASRIECMAREWGVGIIEVERDRARVLLAAGPATLGVPSVYRWWIAELAYRTWLYESTQLVS